MMNLIVVVDKNYGIGKDGKLLCHLSNDLKNFKKITLGKSVIMGRKTLESFPGGKPLPERENIVLTNNMEYVRDDVIILHSIEDVLSYVKEKEAFVIGGGSVYREMIKYCDTLYITKIDKEFEADTFFPNVDLMKEFNLVDVSEPMTENGITYTFTKYVRER